MDVTLTRATEFYFDGFQFEQERGVLRFHYSTDAGHVFTHELTVVLPKDADLSKYSAAAFALGMAELAHYWKAIVTPIIIVKAGKLDAEQIVFWENLYTKGLGEFFYTNHIDFRGLVTIESSEDAPEISPTMPSAGKGALVPVGGGKDSLVTGEILKKANKDFSWFELEPLPFVSKLLAESGNTKSIFVGRDVQKNFAPILELVKQGAPNGHVPITATYIFSGVLAAQMNGFSDVVLSLERSAEEGNVEYLGLNINHQYSKTLEFERQAHDYIQKYIDPSIRVFSLLRPLYELQIVQDFTKYPQYFSSFVSCNRGLKTGTWCGECAKCAFMFAALAAFLPIETVVNIFKKNLFEDTSLIPLYKELIGEGEVKPFDCVGTYEENVLALYLAGERYRIAGDALPAVLTALPIAGGEKYRSLLEERGPHIIPSDYQIP